MLFGYIIGGVADLWVRQIVELDNGMVEQRSIARFYLEKLKGFILTHRAATPPIIILKNLCTGQKIIGDTTY